MTWTERALLITALTVGVANLASGLWTLLRACQTYKMIKERQLRE